jgi:hypothetical protein
MFIFDHALTSSGIPEAVRARWKTCRERCGWGFGRGEGKKRTVDKIEKKNVKTS